MSARLYAVVAEFPDGESVLAAAQAASAQGFRRMDAFTPFPVEGLAEAVGVRKNRVPLFALLGGIAGASTGYGLQLFSATVDYPLNVGGRPLHSWPAFVPITFELTVLFAALSAVLAMLALNGLPRPHHPIFETPHFAERNASHFYLAIEAGEDSFDADAAKRFLATKHANDIWEVAVA